MTTKELGKTQPRPYALPSKEVIEANWDVFISMDQKIIEFSVKFLNPKAELSRMFEGDTWTLLMAQTKGLNWPVVHDLIRRLDYDEYFTSTLYWRFVADKVKSRDNYTCRSCGRDSLCGVGFEAHHRTYEHHGSEHLFLEDLETLCAICHSIVHGQLARAAIKLWESEDGNEYRRLQLFRSAIHIPK